MEVAIKRRIPKEYLGAFKAGHRKAAREFIDQDYTEALLAKAELGDKQAIEALRFLTKYNNEHYKCVFKKDGTDFVQTKEEQLERYRDQNKRYSDVLSNTTPTVDSYDLSKPNPEDLLILLIDLKKERDKAKKQ